MNPKLTRLFHLKSEDLLLFVPNTPQKYVNFIAKDVRIKFALSVFRPVNMSSTKKLTSGKKINDTKADFQNDFKDLEETILSKHEAVVSQITVQIAEFEKNSRNLKLDIDKKGEEWHKEIDNIIKKLKEDIDAMDSKQRTVLNKHKNEFTRRISEIKKAILDHKNILNLHDFNRLSAYKSRNAEFRKLPPKATVSLPSFTSHQINKEQINQQFGVLSALSIKEE